MELLQHYKNRKKEIKQRLKDFKNQKDHFYELCFCLLTPQSNAFKCNECIQILKNKDFLGRSFDIKPILRKYTRFYKIKSKYLIEIRNNKNNILKELNSIKNPNEKRDFLVENVKGLGLKEASHFLRNIGNRNLAILDRHILKNLEKLNIIKEIPKNLNKHYFEIEKKFMQFSKDINIDMDELDLLFWSMQTGKVFK